jgi:acyl transferase domain-containing protein/NADPH:quinone reductase-like Zn-dependent oxidoreductase/NAD(P)-dependent dehydrogenase (short-subunit alcohol dehydrogenase family)/acyl carrier protein
MHRPQKKNAEEIQTWLISQISQYLQIEPGDIDIKEPFTSYGLASRDAIILSGDMEDWLGRQLSPTLLYEYPSIETITEYLVRDPDTSKAGTMVEKAQKTGIEDDIQMIAITGIGCRFPKADGPDAFWDLLRGGVDAITEVPRDRWDLEFFYHPDVETPGKMNTRWGGFLEHVDRFDPQFFSIAPREAVRMDPQQRILLEVAWEALEDAGQVAADLAGSKTGVFIGISSNDYGQRQLSDPNLSDSYAGTGNALSIAANRLSYVFGLQGPSMAVDTACSSSLAAIHLACRSLSTGESTLALAGGVNIILSPTITVNFTKAGLMAPDGRCKAFDARANGYVRGEGAGIVVLKPLSRALADGDPVYAVIRGSAVNQDGRSNGLTAPSRQAQENVLREAFQRAGVSPHQVQYIETHGTGTALGDPIEAKALGAVLAENRPPGNRCIIGSVKTNIGHLEAAAGIAGLIKVALSLKHRIIPPSLHFREPNPHISLDELALRVQQHPQPWPRSAGPALAGVSSFGFGGTNAHIVLEEAPRPPEAHEGVHEEEPAVERAYLLPLSTRSREALPDLARAYREFLSAKDEGPGGAALLHNICYTAGVRRNHHKHRLALVGHSREEMVRHLETFLQGEFSAGLSSGYESLDRESRLVFVFSGQGSQWIGMGRELPGKEPVFRAALEECDRLFSRYDGWSLLEELEADESHSRLDETEITQPAIFAIQVALSDLWHSRGIKPDAVVGHSIGEVSAAYAAGVLSLRDAVRVVFHRSRLMQKAAGKGKMALVELTWDEARRELAGYGDRLSAAAINSPTSTVLSGEPAALEEVLQSLRRREISCRVLRLNYAFHCSQMDPFVGELVRSLEGLEPRPAAIPIYSTVTGKVSSGGEFDAAYWGRNIREPVRFAAAVDELLKDGHRIFLETSPHPVLYREISQCLEYRGQEGTVLSSLQRDKQESAMLLETLGRLYTLGYPVQWNRLYPAGGRSVRLPSYPWQRKRLWIESAGPGAGETASELHPLLNRRLHSPLNEIQFQSRLKGDSLSFLSDHRVRGMVVFPASAYLEMALAAAEEVFGTGPFTLQDVVFLQPLVLPGDGVQTVQLILAPVNTGEYEAFSFRVFSLAADTEGNPGTWRLHADGKVLKGRDDPEASTPRHISVEDLQSQYPVDLPVEEFYRGLAEHGLEYGPSFRGIEKLRGAEGESLGRIRLPGELGSGPGIYRLHPVLLDACFQLFAATVGEEDQTAGAKTWTYLPTALKRLHFFHPPNTPLWGRARLRQREESKEDTITGDLNLFDETGDVIAEVSGLTFKGVSGDALSEVTGENVNDWLYEVQWKIKARGESALLLEQDCPHGSWLIFSDRSGMGASLAEFLRGRGEAPVIVFPGETYNNSTYGHFSIDPAQPDDFLRLLQDACGNDGPLCDNVVFLWSLDVTPSEETTADSLKTAQLLGPGSVLHLVRAAAAGRRRGNRPPRLWLVTRGAQPVGSETPTPAVSQAPLWGLGNVIVLEHPELRCVRVDLDPLGEGKGENVRLLFEEIVSLDSEENREDQVAFRRGDRYVPRLVPRESPPPAAGNRLRVPRAAGNRTFRLEITSRGILDNLELRPVKRRHPGPGQVEIEVRAAGLNFRDVLNAMGLYPGDAGLPGGECAGKITAVGEGVKGFKKGDDVIAIAPGCFSPFVTTDAALVVLKPGHLSFEEAAAIPIIFLTAYYGLHHPGKLSAGDRVLIHAAAGGVGMAAVQLCQQAGAEIYATAGSEEKRAFLKSLGIKYVMNSRSLDFAEEVKTLTGGEGVDIVLNSLSGEYIPKSLSILGPGGRFLEIGKTDTWNREKVAQLKSDVSYFIFDLAEMIQKDPGFIRSMLLRLMEEFNEGKLKPPPIRRFDITESVNAFRYMAQARHIGKIVLSLQEEPEAPRFRRDGSYLITGGLGGLGLTLAQWMVEQGARHLVLMGRTDASTPALEVLDTMRKSGVRVEVVKGDVSREDRVLSMLGEIGRSMPPLRGIFHAAGVIEDGVLLHQKQADFEKVMAPKVQGAWNLHSSTLDRELDFFVLFSSATSIFGTPGQGGYAAANAFLDVLAHFRRNLGLPALSINWGPWAGVGMAAALSYRGMDQWKAAGIGKIEPEQGMRVLGRVLGRSVTQVTILPVKWPTFIRQFDMRGGPPPLFSEVVRELNLEVKENRGLQPRAELSERLEAAPPGQRHNILVDYLREQVKKVLQLDPSHSINPQQGLFELGMDSLMAVELKNRIEKGIGRSLPMVLTFDYPTVETLANYISKEVLSLETKGVPGSKTREDAGVRTGRRPGLEQVPGEGTEPIAIIGMGCRFPGGADNPEAFWRLLRDGVDAVTEVPSDRWDVDAFYDPNPDTPGKTYSRWGGFLDRVDRFDARFFGISPREAVKMDPQQRLLLEVSWEALENAGQVPDRLVNSRTGVFIGSSNNDYLRLQMNLGDLTSIDAYTGTGSAASVSSGRLSYILGLQGPNMAVDTACSSSLVAVHLGCQSLRTKECDLALAGGVNLILSPESSIYFSKLRALSGDGRCKTFDAAANGYVQGEGCGVVVLKRLSDAEADGDGILAVIRGSAVNHDGRSSGLTVPNGLAQQAVIREALAAAGVEPAQVGCVEAHGTGTPLGDPIEIQALAAVMGKGRQEGRKLAVGSVKTNIGHLEAAAGIAGLIKMVLALEHKEIPPHLHANELNPHIPWEEIPASVQTELTPWLSQGERRFAGVSAFGFSGTNAHVVLEEAPAVQTAHQEDEAKPDRPYLLPLSARSPGALEAMAATYKNFLSGGGSSAAGSLHDTCYTASVRRNHHDYRQFFIGRSREELSKNLDISPISPGGKPQTHRQKLVFVFSGQGSQWPGMGRELMEQEPVFRETLELCDREIKRHANWSLLEELAADESHSRLKEVDVLQPVLFSIQVALAALWRSLGIEPDAVVGYSLGEVAAAHVSGALNLENAVLVICSRSRVLKQAKGKGSIAVVETSLENAQRAINGYRDRVSIAASSSPTITVLSGDPTALQEVLDNLKNQDIFCLSREEDVAVHSTQLEPLQDELFRALEGLEQGPVSLPLLSTVTGDAGPMDFDARYWVRNLREPVLFSAVIHRLVSSGFEIFLEISPHPHHLSSIREELNLLRKKGKVLPSMRKKESEREVMLRSLGTLYTLGYPVEWSKLYPSGGRCVQLPSYPWQREHCWLETREAAYRRVRGPVEEPGHLLPGRYLELACSNGNHTWEIFVNSRSFPYLKDHRIQEIPVLPVSFYVEMVLAAAAKVFGAEPLSLEKLEFQQALFLPGNGARRVQVILSSDGDGDVPFHIYSRPEGGEQEHVSWTQHACGKINRHRDGDTPPVSNRDRPETIRARCPGEVPGGDFYSKLDERGIQYGPFFRRIERLRRGNGEAFGELAVSPALMQEIESYQLHPAVLDACLQVLGATLPMGKKNGNNYNEGLYLPVRIEAVRVWGRPGPRMGSYARFRFDPETNKANGDTLEGDVRLLDEAGKVMVDVTGVRFRCIGEDAGQVVAENPGDLLYEVQWQPYKPLEKQPARESSLPPGPGSWLIFADSGGIGKALTRHLTGQGEKCFLVSPGDTYKRTYKSKDKEYSRINPGRPGDFQKLFEDIPGGDQPPCRGIVYLWGLDAPQLKDADVSSLEKTQYLGCGGILHIVQQLVRAGLSEPPPLWLVTRGAQPVNKTSTPLAVTQAPIWGFGRVAAVEHPELWGGLVDLDPGASKEQNSLYLTETVLAPGKEDQLAFRGGQCYAARLKRSRETPTHPLRLHPDASYLITGGLGDLGLKVARWMVEKGARRLILLGRTTLPPRSGWKKVEKGSPMMRRVTAVRELEKLGADVYTASVDAADETQMTSFLKAFARKGWPGIRGVLHAAGVVQGGALLNLDIAALGKVFRPKVVGGWLLHRLFADAPLDFFILFSSMSSQFGWLGQGAANYAAANAFLDALAYHRRGLNKTALSVSWGPWSQVGMAARAPGGIEHFLRFGIGGIAPGKGMKVLELLVQRNSIQKAAAAVNWPQFFKASYGAAGYPFLSHLAEEVQNTGDTASRGEEDGLSREDILRAEPAERYGLLESHFREKLAKILRLPTDQLDVHKPVIEMGLDSLMALEMKTRIQTDLEVSVPLLAFLQNPSLAGITTQVLHLLEESPAAREIPGGTKQEDPEQLLAQIDKLSDKEVDTLLKELYTPGEGG